MQQEHGRDGHMANTHVYPINPPKQNQYPNNLYQHQNIQYPAQHYQAYPHNYGQYHRGEYYATDMNSQVIQQFQAFNGQQGFLPNGLLPMPANRWDYQTQSSQHQLQNLAQAARNALPSLQHLPKVSQNYTDTSKIESFIPKHAATEVLIKRRKDIAESITPPPNSFKTDIKALVACPHGLTSFEIQRDYIDLCKDIKNSEIKEFPLFGYQNITDLLLTELASEVYQYSDPEGSLRWKSYANEKTQHVHALIHSNPRSKNVFKATRFVDVVKPGKIPDWVVDWIFQLVRETVDLNLSMLENSLDVKVKNEMEKFSRFQIDNLKRDLLKNNLKDSETKSADVVKCGANSKYFGCKTLRFMIERIPGLKINKKGVIMFKSLSEKSSKSSIILKSDGDSGGEYQLPNTDQNAQTNTSQTASSLTEHLKQTKQSTTPDFTFKLTKFISPSEFYIIKETKENLSFIKFLKNLKTGNYLSISDLKKDTIYLFKGKRCKYLKSEEILKLGHFVYFVDFSLIEKVSERSVFQGLDGHSVVWNYMNVNGVLESVAEKDVLCSKCKFYGVESSSWSGKCGSDKIWSYRVNMFLEDAVGFTEGADYFGKAVEKNNVTDSTTESILVWKPELIKAFLTPEILTTENTNNSIIKMSLIQDLLIKSNHARLKTKNSKILVRMRYKVKNTKTMKLACFTFDRGLSWWVLTQFDKLDKINGEDLNDKFLETKAFLYLQVKKTGRISRNVIFPDNDRLAKWLTEIYDFEEHVSLVKCYKWTDEFLEL